MTCPLPQPPWKRSKDSQGGATCPQRSLLLGILQVGTPHVLQGVTQPDRLGETPSCSPDPATRSRFEKSFGGRAAIARLSSGSKVSTLEPSPG